MSIFVNKNTRVLVQGITGSVAMFHTQKMLEYGTNVVAGTTPGKGGQVVFDKVPVFNTVAEAVEKTGANASVIYVPARFAVDALLEAAEAGIEFIACITEHIPVIDMLKARRYLEGKKTKMIGPNCPGIITVDECRIGLMPAYIHRKGHVGVVSRSGTLTYETIDQMTKSGIGQSTAIGIGGDPIKGLDFIDVLDAFNKDDDTEAVVMIGEIGGTAEEEAARWVQKNMKKPVVGFIGGRMAPPGKRMGHAGAIVSGGKGTAAEKIRVMNECGIKVAESLTLIGETLVEVLKERGLYEKCKTC